MCGWFAETANELMPHRTSAYGVGNDGESG